MATGTPFHTRTAALCKSHDWRQWSGYLVAGSYDDFVQPEYAAIRHSAALIDVSPLYKYRVTGSDSPAFMDRLFTHRVGTLEANRAVYTPWCDSAGKVRQDGTVFRLDDGSFQINAAEPALGWFQANATGFSVEIHDRSLDVAVLSLQGPRARDVLRDASSANIDSLRFFRLTTGEIAGAPVTISRTGYTGDLGYEIWIDHGDAISVFDALLEAGVPHHLTPCGLKAMDVARVEAGFVLIGVDYISAENALVEDDQMSPYELGLGWAVKLDKPSFVGRTALAEEDRVGSRRRVIGLEIDWAPLEALYLPEGLMPELPLVPAREPVPLYASRGGRQIGRATTRVWSSLLKRFLAIATVEAPHAQPGMTVQMEVTVRYTRQRVSAKVVQLPFFRPDRMRG